MVYKLRCPNGGAVVVLSENIAEIEVPPSPESGRVIVHMANGASYPVVYGQAEEIETVMTQDHPVVPSLLPSPPAQAAAK